MKNDPTLFKNLVEYTPHAFVFANMEGKVLMSNPAADKLYGYDRGELLGMNVDVFNSKETVETEIIVNDIIEKGYWQGELVQKKKDGSTFHAELTVNLTFNGGVPIGLCSYSRDISDKKEAESQLMVSQSLLMSSAKLSAIGEMAGGIAHEINTPLSIIMNKANRIERHLDPEVTSTKRILEDLKDIEETASRIK